MTRRFVITGAPGIRQKRIYEPRVFFLGNLGFIEASAARRISFEESLKFEAVHEQVYEELGYELVPIPPESVEARAAILSAAIRWLLSEPFSGRSTVSRGGLAPN